MMKRWFATFAVSLVVVAGLVAWPVVERAAARQAEPEKTGQVASDKEKLEKAGEALKQEGGKVKDPHRPTPDIQHQRGKIFRPLVPEGGSGGEAPEEGTFTLAPGDMLELECAIPKNMPAHLTYKVEDGKIVQLLPTGVRTLVPVSMIGGKPKPITGLIRYAALFQAQEEGETTIRLTLGRKMYQYGVEVKKEAPGTHAEGEGKDVKIKTHEEPKSKDEP